MSDKRETDQPNEEGFAGDPTTPEPRRDRHDPHARAEDEAVPGGDLTEGLSEALQDLGPHRDSTGR